MEGVLFWGKGSFAERRSSYGYKRQLGFDHRAGRVTALPHAEARRGREIAPDKGKISLLVPLSLRQWGFQSPWYPKTPG